MRNSLIIKDEKEQLKKRNIEILETCKVEIRDFNEDEKREYDLNISKIENLNNELKELEERLSNENETNNKSINTKIKMEKEFRLLSAIRDIADNKQLDEVASAVIAKGNEEMRKGGVNGTGQIQLPVSEMRAAVTVATEHDDIVATDVFNVLEPLRAKNVLVNAGARFLTGLVGDVVIPSLDATNVTWEGEVSAATDGYSGITSVKLQPKRLTAYIDLSKQFLVQDGADAERVIREDIINAINSKLEATILGEASGTTTQPAGIFYPATGLTSISAFSGICALEASVEDANVLGECKYVLSNKAKAKLRGMLKGTNNTGMVYEYGSVDGTEAFNTSNVPNSDIAFGDWSNLAIGQWGGIDLTVDPYSRATYNEVRLVVNAFFDAKVVREGTIAVGKIA